MAFIIRAVPELSTDILRRCTSTFAKLRSLLTHITRTPYFSYTTYFPRTKYRLLSAEDAAEIKKQIKFWITVYVLGFITSMTLKFILTVGLTVAILFGFTPSTDDEHN